MYWLPRPPYLRWAGAVLLILGALAWDLRAPAEDLRPFASREVAAGETLEAAAIAWRRVPAGLLPAAEPAGARVVVHLAAGDPLVPAVLSREPAVPEGWWELSLPVGTHVAAGAAVRLLIADPPATVPGVVIRRQEGDAYSLGYRPAVVAVPAEAAVAVAAAAREGTLVAAVAP